MNLRKISTGRPRLERKNWLSLKSATMEELRVKRKKLEITQRLKTKGSLYSETTGVKKNLEV